MLNESNFVHKHGVGFSHSQSHLASDIRRTFEVKIFIVSMINVILLHSRV